MGKSLKFKTTLKGSFVSIHSFHLLFTIYLLCSRVADPDPEIFRGLNPDPVFFMTVGSEPVLS